MQISNKYQGQWQPDRYYNINYEMQILFSVYSHKYYKINLDFRFPGFRAVKI